MMTFTPTPLQHQAIAHKGHALVLGGAGTGKTTVLVERVAHLLQAGVEGRDIVVVTFSYRQLLLLRHLLKKRLGDASESVITATMRDLALDAVEKKAETPLLLADNNFLRRVLRQAMRQVQFVGTIREAEHIVRTFYGRARRPDENERHANLFFAYRDLIQSYQRVDRYSLIRQHLLGMKEGTYQPFSARYMLVDTLQDVTQIQLMWLMEHARLMQVSLTLLGNDDERLFARDGALGREAFDELMEDERFTTVVLDTNFRTEAKLAETAEKFVAGAKGHIEKPTLFEVKGKGVVKAEGDETFAGEMETLFGFVNGFFTRMPEGRLAIATRHAREAQRLAQVLQSRGVAHADFSPSLWEMPGALAVVDLLQVLLDHARNEQLRNLLVVMGLKTAFVNALFTHGLVAEGWLRQGAPLPSGIDLPKDTLLQFQHIQRKLLLSFEALCQRQAKPKDIFKAFAYDVIDLLDEEDKNDAVVAVERICSSTGHIQAILDAIRKPAPLDFEAALTIAPIQELRNREFDGVLVPFCGLDNFPFLHYQAIGKDLNHERRLFYMAVSRARRFVGVTWHGDQSPFIDEFEKLYRM